MGKPYVMPVDSKRCSFVKDNGERCKARKRKDYEFCNVHSLSKEERREMGRRGGRAETKSLYAEATATALAKRPFMKPGDQLLVAETIREELRALKMNPDTGRIEPDQERRLLGVYLAAMFFENDEEVQRLLGFELERAMRDREDHIRDVLRHSIRRNGLLQTQELIAKC